MSKQGDERGPPTPAKTPLCFSAPLLSWSVPAWAPRGARLTPDHSITHLLDVSLAPQACCACRNHGRAAGPPSLCPSSLLPSVGISAVRSWCIVATKKKKNFFKKIKDKWQQGCSLRDPSKQWGLRSCFSHKLKLSSPWITCRSQFTLGSRSFDVTRQWIPRE